MRAAERTLLEDMDTMRALAREAGELAVSYQVRSHKNRVWHKQGGSPVTEADIEVNRLCAAHLQRARPEYGWLSEETTDSLDARRKQRCWVVDPIDGTRAYMRDDPNWCVALAVIEEGRAVAGVLYAPRQDRFYEAWHEGGAFLNGQAIRVSACVAESGCRLITNEGMIDHPAWPEPWPEVVIARPKPNSTLLRMALVATGEWDATVTLAGKSDWDLAAGTVLVEQAGGVVTTHKGEPLVFNQEVPAQRSVIAAGARLHPLLVRRTEFVGIPDPQERAACTATTTEQKNMGDAPKSQPQLLHIVFGGELKDVTGVEFEDLSKIDFIGAFPNYKDAYDAWKSAAQRTVDHAEMRYFILHAHKLLDPLTGDHHHV